ncbi:MAG: response regulator [Nitrospirae bacterium]|nr:response regulator [Magnetococcales bacterium]HAT50986.1 excisionase [Alphaproteobacteria bacterium]
MKKKLNELITTTEAAKLLGVARRSVQLWMEKGVLRAMKTPGGHRRITRESVEALLKEWNAVMESETVPDQLTLLIVEDDPVFLEFYRGNVTEWGADIRIITAENGFEGLLRIGQQKPDIVIADLKMPMMDGVELIRCIKANQDFSMTHIIAVTAMDDHEIRKRGGLPDDVAIFHKPPPMDQIRKIVEDTLQARRQSNREAI